MTRLWIIVLCAVVLIFGEVGFIAWQALKKLDSIHYMLTNTLPVPPNKSYAELVLTQDRQIEDLLEKQERATTERAYLLQVTKSVIKLMDSISNRQDRREARQVKVEKRQDQFDVDLMNVMRDLEAQKNIEANRSSKPPGRTSGPRR